MQRVLEECLGDLLAAQHATDIRLFQPDMT